MSITLPKIEAIFSVGATLYVTIHNRLTGQVWNNTLVIWQTWNIANWSEYAIPLTEQNGSGYYVATRPAGTSGALMSETLYQQAGGSPVSSDAPPQALNKSAGENISAISGDAAVAPTNFQGALSTETQGAVATGVISSQSFPTTLVNTVAGAYQGLTIRFISGNAAGMAGLIANYEVTNGVITLSGSLAAAPAATDTFIIV